MFGDVEIFDGEVDQGGVAFFLAEAVFGESTEVDDEVGGKTTEGVAGEFGVGSVEALSVVFGEYLADGDLWHEVSAFFASEDGWGRWKVHGEQEEGRISFIYIEVWVESNPAVLVRLSVAGCRLGFQHALCLSGYSRS